MILQTVDLQLYSLMFTHQAKQTFLLCSSHNTYKSYKYSNKSLSLSVLNQTSSHSMMKETRAALAFLSLS